ncbi:MAG: ABC transporter permease [Chloroflexi bacterium]|nr:ABC transporter permease [Chloroflexota bacterium]MCL5110997.1 ABC transporter permease [Chloroflexota bacterium]
MRNYLIRRLGEMAVLLLLISALVFVILSFVPGGPFDLLIFSNPRITAAEIKRLNEAFGFDKPLYIRYFQWLVDVAGGHWGTSWGIAYGRPVTEVILARLNNTLILMGAATLVSVIIALPIGIYSAIRQYSWADYFVTSLSFFGMSMPTFWFGIMLIVIFAVGLGWFPTGGVSTYGLEGDILDRIRHLALPVTVLSLFNVATWSRFVRSSMLEVLRQDYMRTARAKGLRENVVIIKHGLRNSLIPVMTMLALEIPGLFSGAIITETVFSYPGMGRLFWDGVMAADWPVVQGLVMITAFLVIACNLVADVAYAVVDPRIRYD